MHLAAGAVFGFAVYMWASLLVLHERPRWWPWWLALCSVVAVLHLGFIWSYYDLMVLAGRDGDDHIALVRTIGLPLWLDGPALIIGGRLSERRAARDAIDQLRELGFLK